MKKITPSIISALSVSDVCQQASVSRSTLYAEIKSGRLKAHKIGRRTVVREVDVEEWLSNLPQIASQKSSEVRK